MRPRETNACTAPESANPSTSAHRVAQNIENASNRLRPIAPATAPNTVTASTFRCWLRGARSRRGAWRVPRPRSSRQRSASSRPTNRRVRGPSPQPGSPASSGPRFSPREDAGSQSPRRGAPNVSAPGTSAITVLTSTGHGHALPRALHPIGPVLTGRACGG